MKIISKFRDYYDHLVAYYGFDPERVYDRRGTKPFFFSDTKSGLLSICGQYYAFERVNGKYSYTKPSHLNPRRYESIWDKNGLPSDENVKYRQPVLFCDDGGKAMVGYVPRLLDFDFPVVMTPDEIYQAIYNFLGWLKDNPEPVNNQTDKEKVTSHGFDIKRSFRPKMA